jgi:phosphatidylglycerophosphate synthase
MLTRWRPLYERMSIPFGRASLKFGLTPDFWTLFSLFAAGVSCAALAMTSYWLGFLGLVVMNLADMLDGATARAGNMESAFGTILDHSCDRYGEFLLYGGLMLGGAISPTLALFTASGVVMASYVRAKAESVGGLKSCSVGLAGRQEKLFLTIAGLILFGFNVPFPAQICIFLAGLISHVTFIQRLIYARNQILKPDVK